MTSFSAGYIAGVEIMAPVNSGHIWVADTEGQGAGRPPESGEAVVLLHPGWGDSRIWEPMMPLLPGHLRVVRYDLRGFGQSPAPAAPYSQLGDLISVLDQRQITRALLVGHSGGAGTAIGLALADPARVSGLLLLAPGVPDYPWPHDDPYWQEFETAFTAGDREALIDLGLRTWAAASADEAARGQISSAVTAYFQLGEFEQPDPPAFARLAEISAPTIVVLGDRDSRLVTGSAQAIAARISGSRLISASGVDHLVPLRIPALIADLIAAWQ